MPGFNVFDIVDQVDKKSPVLSKKLGTLFLNLISPFNSHMKSKLLDWTPTRASFQIDCHRGVKNHLGGIHAGALFTLGETCAGFILIKNFSLKNYRPIMKEASASYEKQGRGTVIGTAEISEAQIVKMKKGLKTSDPQFVTIDTHIENDKKELVALVTTKWQIKPWDQVKPASK